MSLTPLLDALEEILATATGLPETEVVPLEAAVYRYCAIEVKSLIAVPPADNSAMDGYAVRSLETPAELPVSQRIPAGQPPEFLKSGTAARVFTGAEIPPGADSVVIQEKVKETLNGVKIPAVSAGENIRRRGQDIREGDEIIPKGRCLLPQDLGLLASVGQDQVAVFRPIRVALLTTGNELRDPGVGTLEPGEIFNSNRVGLAAQIRLLGMSLLDLGNIPDDARLTGRALKDAASRADCVITVGGVSAGEEDHVRREIERLGKLVFWKLAIKPGKPIAFGKIEETPVFGLPGNPVSSWITFALIVKPWLLKRQGGRLSPPPRFPVRSEFEISKASIREEFLRVYLRGSGETMRAVRTGSQSSGVLSSLGKADGLAIIPAGEIVRKGDWLEVIPMQALLAANYA